MKNLLLVFSVLILLVSCTQTKIAYVDIAEVMQEYKGSKQAEEEMKAKSEKMAQEIDQLAQPFQLKVQEYQNNSKNLSQTEKAAKEQELMQEQQVIQRRQQLAQQQVQEEGQIKMNKINEEIDTFVAEYAKSNGYNFIFGTSEQTKSILYGDESLNITDKIIEALNNDYSPSDPILTGTENSEE
jgi:outer membrane protein